MSIKQEDRADEVVEASRHRRCVGDAIVEPLSQLAEQCAEEGLLVVARSGREVLEDGNKLVCRGTGVERESCDLRVSHLRSRVDEAGLELRAEVAP